MARFPRSELEETIVNKDSAPEKLADGMKSNICYAENAFDFNYERLNLIG
jgi:hypothetical protein